MNYRDKEKRNKEIEKEIERMEYRRMSERERERERVCVCVCVMLPKLALANLAELLAITPDKPTCDTIGNCPSSIIRVNA